MPFPIRQPLFKMDECGEMQFARNVKLRKKSLKSLSGVGTLKTETKQQLMELNYELLQNRLLFLFLFFKFIQMFCNIS